jgi:hypothetical protein
MNSEKLNAIIFYCKRKYEGKEGKEDQEGKALWEKHMTPKNGENWAKEAKERGYQVRYNE